jgi:two-component system chemotaxis response regulator CheY
MNKATVLLIDDSKTIRDIIKIYLMGWPLEFLDADTSERGISLLRVTPVNLVIADIKLPGMDGLQLVKTIRTDLSASFRNVPIILLTGEKGMEMRMRGLESGANGYLSKPIDNATLIDLVAQLLPPDVKPAAAQAQRAAQRR